MWTWVRVWNRHAEHAAEVFDRLQSKTADNGVSHVQVFKGEGFPTPTDERHCVNSVSIKFVPAKP